MKNPSVMRIYVVNLEMSSPNQLNSSEKIDDMTQKLNYKFTAKKRKEIHAVNQFYKSKVYANVLDFHGLRICKEEQLPLIIDLSSQANEAIQILDPSLHATLAYFGLDMAEVSKGDAYGQVLSAIRYQIISEVLGRLEKVTETQAIDQLSKQSKTALLKMIDRLKAINILDDKGVETKLESLKTAIMTDTIAPMKKELIDEMLAIKRGGAYLKFREDTPQEGTK